MTTPIPCPGLSPAPVPVPQPEPPKPAPSGKPWFKAATWNVLYKVPVSQLEGTFLEMQKAGVSIILNQEAGRAGISAMFKKWRWETFVVDNEYRVSWNPAVWDLVSQRSEQLTSTAYFRKGKKNPIIMRAARVVLRHKKTGRTVDALSYHLPSAVQRGGPNKAVARRLTALRSSMQTLARLARESAADAILFGGDDNVDERLGKGWGFMLKAATGLSQITAPRGTLGKGGKNGRRIDDFRTLRLIAGKGSVMSTRGDHWAHLRDFRFA